MKSWIDLPARALVAVLWVAVVSASTAQDDENLPIENVILPVEVYDDGTVKTRFLAGRARIPAAGPIVATDVKIEFYKPDGQLESRVMADRCRSERAWHFFFRHRRR